VSFQVQITQCFIHLLSARWTLLLLGALSERGRRHNELHDNLDGISHKVLTDTLRHAERDGLIVRQLDAGRIGTPLRSMNSLSSADRCMNL
jgi:DNA-binding HxlR family transcriptional regulator